jgi:AcrR family transcriptional regulator
MKRTKQDEALSREQQHSPRAGKRPGGRSAQVREAVLAATLELLSQRGYAAMTTRDIAALAGVNEVSLFRRWGTKAAIVAEAIQHYSATETPTPDTGSLQGDLQELLRGIMARIQTPLGRVIGHIVVGHHAQPELEEVRRTYWRDRFSRAEAIIQRAKERGELAQEIDAQFLVEAAIGPIVVRNNATDQPLDESLPERIISLIFHGIQGPAEATLRSQNSSDPTDA